MSCSCIGWAFCFVLFPVVVGRVSEGDVIHRAAGGRYSCVFCGFVC